VLCDKDVLVTLYYQLVGPPDKTNEQTDGIDPEDKQIDTDAEKKRRADTW
jgi:hypothetical protein